jgi:predicted amidohydrolase
MLKKHPKKTISIAVITLAAIYLFWPGFAPASTKPELHLNHFATYGENQGFGNVIGIEPYMEALDYSTPARFQEKLDGYLNAAYQKNWINEETIVLFPEHLGTWLMATDMGARIYSASSTAEAMRFLLLPNFTAFLKNYFVFEDAERVTASLVRARSKETAKQVMEVFSNLASKYGVTIVAGSQTLMTPGVYRDSLSYGHGPIFNSSFVFGPDGTAQIDAVRKVHPIPSEAGFIKPSSPDFLPVFEHPHYPFSVLICADSWFEDTTQAVAASGAKLLLVPSFLEGTNWNEPWQGYVNETPKDNSWKGDVGNISEGEAWQKHALYKQAQAANINWGLNVFLKGKLWDMEGDGRALILENGALHVGESGKNSAALYNLWLGSPD